MGKYADRLNRAVTDRRAAEEAALEAGRQRANDAVMPLYEKVMPELNRAKADLEASNIEVKIDPPWEKRVDDKRAHLAFQITTSTLTTDEGSIFRFSWNADDDGLTVRNESDPKSPQILKTKLKDLTDAQIEEVFNLAIDELAAKIA